MKHSEARCQRLEHSISVNGVEIQSSTFLVFVFILDGFARLDIFSSAVLWPGNRFLLKVKLRSSLYFLTNNIQNHTDLFREKEDHEKELFQQWKRLNHQYTESALTNTTMKSLLENFSQYHHQEKALPHEQQNMTNEIRQTENKFDPFHDYI